MMTPEMVVDVDRDETGQTDFTKYIRFAKVIKVYDSDTFAEGDAYGCVDLVWLDTLDQINGHISFIKPGYSAIYGSGIIVMPNVNDIAACYVVQDSAPIILGFFSKDQFMAATNEDLKEGYGEIGYIRPLKSGEILIKGRSQSEIYLKRDGSIRLTVQDGTSTKAAATNQVTLNNEPLVERPSSSAFNTQVEVLLGADSTKSGPGTGYGTTVFSIDASKRFKSSVILDAAKGVLSYSIPVDTSSEIVEIEKVVICTISEGTVVVKKEVTNGIKLDTQYTYFPQEVGANGATKDPCTLDINHSFAFITLPRLVAGDVVSGVKLIVHYIAKKKTLSLAGNKLGDLFIDARNIVMRAADSNSYLGLFGNGNVRLGGSSIEIGDRLRGHILVDKAGVVSSPGISPFGAVVAGDKETSVSTVGFSQVFYITDDWPLFSYDSVTKKYEVCDYESYRRLSMYDRCDILPRAFDASNTASGFTEEDAKALMEEYKSKNGTYPITYGEVKTL